ITGGAGTQHLVRGGVNDAAFSSSVSVRGRWLTQTLSCASTATPAACPMIQLLGSGFGQDASTWNLGKSLAKADVIDSAQTKSDGTIFMDFARRRWWRAPACIDAPLSGRRNQGEVVILRRSRAGFRRYADPDAGRGVRMPPSNRR